MKFKMRLSLLLCCLGSGSLLAAAPDGGHLAQYRVVKRTCCPYALTREDSTGRRDEQPDERAFRACVAAKLDGGVTYREVITDAGLVEVLPYSVSDVVMDCRKAQRRAELAKLLAEAHMVCTGPATASACGGGARTVSLQVMDERPARGMRCGWRVDDEYRQCQPQSPKTQVGFAVASDGPDLLCVEEKAGLRCIPNDYQPIHGRHQILEHPPVEVEPRCQHAHLVAFRNGAEIWMAPGPDGKEVACPGTADALRSFLGVITGGTSDSPGDTW